MNEGSCEYKVVEKIKESESISTIFLAPSAKPKPSFISGQFITIYFPELGVAEGKAYSLSSSPHENYISVTVKEIGEYSRKLRSLDVGDTLMASEPHGFFFSEEDSSHLVMVAGGIGIAPFRGMLISCMRENMNRRLTLYYSVSSLKDAVFYKELQDLRRSLPHFSFHLHVTKENPSQNDVRSGRISVEELAQEYEKDDATEYMLCGSIPFVRDMWKGLKHQGIPEERVYTEAFFS